MIYIKNEIDTNLLYRLLSLCINLKINNFSLWFYPETNKEVMKFIENKLNDVPKNTRSVEPVTYYDGDNNTSYTNTVYELNESSIKIIEEELTYIKNNCDSIAFYEKDGLWSVCSIFHEKMSFVKNNDVSIMLDELEIKYSLSPPENW